MSCVRFFYNKELGLDQMLFGKAYAGKCIYPDRVFLEYEWD